MIASAEGAEALVTLTEEGLEVEGEAEVVDATTTTFDETGQGEFGFLDEVEPAVRTPAGGGTGTTASSGGTAAQLELPLGEGGTGIVESGAGQSGGDTIQIENEGTQGLTGQPGASINNSPTMGVAAKSATQLEFQFAPQVEQYALRAADSGFYPVMVRGSENPQFITYLEKGDVWKFGTTANPATRYSGSYLPSIGEHGVEYSTEFLGTEQQAVQLQNMKIQNFIQQTGKLPPGNKIIN